MELALASVVGAAPAQWPLNRGVTPVIGLGVVDLAMVLPVEVGTTSCGLSRQPAQHLVGHCRFARSEPLQRRGVNGATAFVTNSPIDL